MAKKKLITKREAKAAFNTILDEALMGTKTRPDVTANYYRYRQFSPSLCAKGSMRTIQRGKVKIVVCCPKGKWQPRKQRCKVGTRAQSILKPRR